MNDKEAIRKRATEFAGVDPAAYIVVEVASREPQSDEEAEATRQGMRPIKAKFTHYIGPDANPLDMQQAAISLAHCSRLVVLAIAKDVEEYTEGRIKAKDFVKVVYDESRKLFEGHPDAVMGALMPDKVKPRKRDNDPPEDKKKGLTP